MAYPLSLKTTNLEKGLKGNTLKQFRLGKWWTPENVFVEAPEAHAPRLENPRLVG